LRLAREVTAETTFLGAHVVPPRTDPDAYVELVTGPMLSACAPHARWVDVFCEPASAHAFDGDEARAVLEAGRAAGLGLRVHANQLSAGPGVRLAVELAAASADHCTHLTDADVDALAGGTTVATLLPGVEFSTRSPYPRCAPAPGGRRHRRPWPPTATRAAASRRRWRSASRWPSARCG
jgi:imidazolonepropionase